jgi:predicted nucleotidyltransferase
VAPSFAALTAWRTAERARLASTRAALVIERLRTLVVGSLARGDFRLHSHVDFLIVGKVAGAVAVFAADLERFTARLDRRG